MNIKRIIIPLLLILFMASMVAFGAPVYVNVGPTTEFDGDIKILSEIVAEGTTPDGWETTIFFTDPTADRIITIPDFDVTAGTAVYLTVTDNENTNETNAVLFTSGGELGGGVLGIESDGDYYYNPSDGSVHATLFYGDGSNLTGVGAAAATALTFIAKEENTSAMVKGQPVYISGAVGAAFPTIGLTDCDDSTKIRIAGLAAEAITQNTTGLVRRAGLLTGVDTLGANDVNPNGEAWAAGDILYVDDTAGGLTNVKPTSGRIIKAAYTLYGSSNTDDLLVVTHENPVYIACAPGEDIDLRMGDEAGVNKVIFEDYADNEVAFIDSNGQADFNSLILDNPLLPAEGGTGVANVANNTITFTGNFTLGITLTANTTITLPTSGTIYGTLADSITSANLLSSVSDETGTGVLVFGTAPTFTNGITATDYILFDNIDYVTKIGYQAGKNIVFGAQYNVFIGYQAGLSNDGSSTDAADNNVAIGYQAFKSNTIGTNNVAVGYLALEDSTTGDQCVAIGANALKNNTTGDNNIAIGVDTLQTNTTGFNNMGLGKNCLYSNTEGDRNCAMGLNALRGNTTGNSNVGIGEEAGWYQADGTTPLIPNTSVYLGAETRGFDNNDDNSIVIGYAAIGTGPNHVVLGNTSITQTTLRGNVLIPVIVFTVVTMADGDATPDISGGTIFESQSNTGATEITDLDNPTVGQTLTIIVGDAGNPPTITDGGNFALSAAWTPDLDDTITLYVQADNDYIEIGRSTN